MYYKKLNNISLIICILIVLTACSGGSYKIIMGDIETTGDSISGSYKKFSGHYFKTVELAKNDILHISFNSNTKKGAVSAKLVDSDDNTVMKIDNNTGAKTEIEQAGDYKLKVIGDDHKGNFELTWEIE